MKKLFSFILIIVVSFTIIPIVQAAPPTQCPLCGSLDIDTNPRYIDGCCTTGREEGYFCYGCWESIDIICPITECVYEFDSEYSFDATCTNYGVELYNCVNCHSGIPEPIIIPATGHHYTRVEPLTCNEFSCEDCGDTKTVGDIDEEAGLNIKDVTCVQKILAEIIEPSKYNYLADANGDGEVTIKDATYLQLFIAQLIDTFPQN